MPQRIINLDAIEAHTPPTYAPSEAASTKYDMRMGAIATATRNCAISP